MSFRRTDVGLKRHDVDVGEEPEIVAFTAPLVSTRHLSSNSEAECNKERLENDEPRAA